MNQQEWLLKKFRDWEQRSGRKQTEAAFAKHLGIKPPTLNRWMTGSATPEGENMRLLARRLGPEIYEITGQTAPSDLYLTDEILKDLAEISLSIPDHKRAAFREQAAKYLIDLAKKVIEDP